MKNYIIKSIKNFIPPFLVRIQEKLAGNTGFGSNYTTWEEACNVSTGYDSDEILNKVKDALLKVKNGEAVYERDSVLFDKIAYSWPLLTGLLWIASQNGNCLSLVDFGGSLGSSYYQNRMFLSHLKELHWNIVEQEKFVEIGKRYFENAHLKFYYELEECFKIHRPDTILFSSVIQYIENPYTLLETVKQFGFAFIIFDRTPFLERGDDIITIQRIPLEIFDASIPCWLLNLNKFLKIMSSEYELITDFDSFEHFNIKNLVFKGFIFKKRHKI